MGLKTIKEMINFNQATAWDDEVADRKYLTTRLLYTNIKPLDHAFQGLWPNDFVVLSAKTGAGKCLGKDTPVLMYDGSIKMVQDVVHGDKLMGPDSKPRNVKSTTKGESELFRITPIKGDSWVCNDVHILSLRRTGGSEIMDIEIKDYLKLSTTDKNKWKQFRVAVDFKESYQNLDPYFVGLWIGDGGVSGNGNKIHKDDKEVVDFLGKYAESMGLKLSQYQDAGKCTANAIVKKDCASGGKATAIINGIKELIKDGVKCIPNNYLIASREQRLQLLAGILDTDGHLAKNYFDIIQKDKNLADQIAFLAKSLGFSANVVECQKGIKSIGFIGTYYRMSICGDTDLIPTKIKRKQATKRMQIKSVLNTGFTVESIGFGEYFGFEIDGDKRFLLGDFTVTHNTELVSQIAMNVAMQKKKVDLFALEASRYEIQRRIKFKLLSTYYYKDTGKFDVSYSKWTRFQLDDVFAKYTDRLNADLVLLREYLRIHYRQSTFDLGDFIKLYNYYTKDSELVLCDHAQFFDFDDSKDENKHVKDMTLKMYDMIQVCKVPLVLVSHLRKLDDKKSFPDISDIFGSSELTKKATRVVILCRGQYNNEANVFETVMRFEKNREESVVNIKTLFNLGLKQYSEKYELGNIVNNEFVAFT